VIYRKAAFNHLRRALFGRGKGWLSPLVIGEPLEKVHLMSKIYAIIFIDKKDILNDTAII